MELNQLRSFCAVVRCGSFTKAAQEQGIAQPSLSQQMHRLEDSVGTKLFSRVGRSIRLTAAGKLLHSYAVPIVARTARAMAHLHRVGAGTDTILRIGSIPTVLPYLLAPRLKDFSREHPDIDIKLEEDLTARLVARLLAGEVDVIIVTLPLCHHELVTREIMRDPLMIVAPQNHQLAQELISPAVDLSKERLLLLKEGHCLRECVIELCRRMGTEAYAEFESNDLASLFALVDSGIGIAIAPLMALGHAMGCRVVPLPQPQFRRIGYAHLKRSSLRKSLTVFTDWLRLVAGEMST